MIAGATVAILSFILHVFDLNTIIKSEKKPFGVDVVVSILLNICVLFAGMIGFGRPFTPALVYLIGFVIIIICT
jgi:hypothetical protein